MAEQRERAPGEISFNNIQLLKDQTLGIGAYGSVCKAKCDDLLCAAKILHPTLFDPTAHQRIAPQREHRLPFSRFQQECEFMSAIRHPYIVQYLGVSQDPETRLPVLLMELMDDSLTHFLESSREPLPYHTQLNFCHDIAQALSFLHSNGIVHRDLFSNNVLLIGDVRAKVTDFGMVKLSDTSPEQTRSFTMCPGTDTFMSPEAASDSPTHTEKIDCFSFGVLTIQILTRIYPKPGDRIKRVTTVDLQFPGGEIEIRVSEIERRQNHIERINQDNPLLLIAMDCLKDRESDRPSAQELCESVSALKETPEYSESVRNSEEREQRLRQELEEQRITEVNDIQQQHAQDLLTKDEEIAAKEEEIEQLRQEHSRQIEEKDDIITAKHEENKQFHKQFTQQMAQYRLQQIQVLEQTQGALKERDGIIADRQREIQELKTKHSQQMEERNETIAAREREILELKKQHDRTIGRDQTINGLLKENEQLRQQFLLQEMRMNATLSGIPDDKTQKRTLQLLLQQRLKKGDTWYLVDVGWMKQWKKFVGYDQWDQGSVGQESANPGPVDNASLFKYPESEELKEHLMDDLDYYLLPESAWHKLVVWYGLTENSRPIARKVYERGLYMKHCTVEVYLLEFKLYLYPNLNETQRKCFSKLDTVGDIEAVLKQEFEVDKDTECRVWHRYMTHTYELLSSPSQTIYDAGLYKGQTIVLEKKNEDGSWPRQY